MFAHWRRPADARRCLLTAHALYASKPSLPQTRIEEVELAILSNRPDKAMASLAALKQNLYVGGDIGAPFYHAYLTACTHMLTGARTLPQASVTLRRQLEATSGYFFIPDSDLIQALLPHVGLPTRTVAAIRALSKLAKQYAYDPKKP